MRSFATAATCVAPDGSLEPIANAISSTSFANDSSSENGAICLKRAWLAAGNAASAASTSTAFTSAVQRRPASAACAACRVPRPSVSAEVVDLVSVGYWSVRASPIHAVHVHEAAAGLQ